MRNCKINLISLKTVSIMTVLLRLETLSFGDGSQVGALGMIKKRTYKNLIRYLAVPGSMKCKIIALCGTAPLFLSQRSLLECHIFSVSISTFFYSIISLFSLTNLLLSIYTDQYIRRYIFLLSSLSTIPRLLFFIFLQLAEQSPDNSSSFGFCNWFLWALIPLFRFRCSIVFAYFSTNMISYFILLFFIFYQCLDWAEQRDAKWRINSDFYSQNVHIGLDPFFFVAL